MCKGMTLFRHMFPHFMRVFVVIVCCVMLLLFVLFCIVLARDGFSDGC